MCMNGIGSCTHSKKVHTHAEKVSRKKIYNYNYMLCYIIHYLCSSIVRGSRNFVSNFNALRSTFCFLAPSLFIPRVFFVYNSLDHLALGVFYDIRKKCINNNGTWHTSESFIITPGIPSRMDCKRRANHRFCA